MAHTDNPAYTRALLKTGRLSGSANQKEANDLLEALNKQYYEGLANDAKIGLDKEMQRMENELKAQERADNLLSGERGYNLAAQSAADAALSGERGYNLVVQSAADKALSGERSYSLAEQSADDAKALANAKLALEKTLFDYDLSYNTTKNDLQNDYFYEQLGLKKEESDYDEGQNNIASVISGIDALAGLYGGWQKRKDTKDLTSLLTSYLKG